MDEAFKKKIVRLHLENCINQDDLGKPYLVYINGIPAQIKTFRHYNEKTSIPQVNIAPYSKIQIDRYGRLSTMEVQVWFDKHIFEMRRLSFDTEYLISNKTFSCAIEYLNRFISTYKLVTHEYWVPAVMEDDIVGYTVVFFRYNGALLRTSHRNTSTGYLRWRQKIQVKSRL